MPSDSPTEFDFDFQVDQSPADPSRRTADDAPSTGHGRGNGAATPRAPEDLDAPPRTGNGRAKPPPSPRRRRFQADSGDGGGEGRTSNGRGSLDAPLAGRGTRFDGRPGPPVRRPEPIAPPEPGLPAADDWLGLNDAGSELSQFPPSDRDTGSGPRVPREGRTLARAARERAAQRRVEGRSRVDADDVPFESLLERQPQKSKAARRATPLLDAVRDAVGVGRKRLRGGAVALREGGERLRGGAHALRPDRRPRAPRAPQPAPPGATPGGKGKPPPRIPRMASRRPRRPKPGRIKRIRLLIVAAGLALLALVSTFFGMMMAISRNLPALETEQFFAVAQKSEVFDNHGRKIGNLLNNNEQILVDSEEISPYIKQAVVAVEDERFYEHRGVDFMGIGRAAVQDLLPGGGTQGGSTITQQFVKNALTAQSNRTVLQKFRESAIAYHLERQWDKDKILTSYLNTIYYGEGAYGIEAAARTYFGYRHKGCGVEGADSCASELFPHEAAMLAGIITSPSAYSPRANGEAAKARRDLVLTKMKEQGVLGEEEYNDAIAEPLPAPSDIEKPTEDSAAPYFSSWLRQQLVDRYGAGLAFGGGLKVHTTLDLEMQEAVDQIAYDSLAGIEPTASVVVLDNQTGEIRAMVGGNDFEKEPFNLATQGHRQPGSTMKPFILAAALSKGISPNQTYASQVKTFDVPNSGGKEKFEVHNYEDNYLGSCSISCATTYSDNSIYAELGLDDVGTKRVAKTAQEMGIRTWVSRNPAMVLGAPEKGFTPLEMAYAFNTIGAGGKRISGTLDTVPGESKGDPGDDGPVPINKVVNSKGKTIGKNELIETPILSESVAETEKSILETVISSGTGTAAAISQDGEWGKTGTTENYGDAWFCGGSENFTACVWVGHRDSNTSMEYDFGGQPVAGGTYPALIWSRVMAEVESIFAENYRSDEDEDEDEDGESSSGSAPVTDSGSSSGSSSSGGGGGGGGAPQSSAPPPSSGAGGGGGGGGAPSGGGVGL